MSRGATVAAAATAAVAGIALLATARTRREASASPAASASSPSGPTPALARRAQLLVPMSCGSCAADVTRALRGVSGVATVDVDLDKQLVLVSGTGFTTAGLIAAVEETGRDAKLVGSGSAVAPASASASASETLAQPAVVPAHVGPAVENSALVVEYKGRAYGHDSVVGVVRVVQTTPEECVVEWELAGLAPGEEHGVTLHEFGDTRDGARFVGRAVISLGSAVADASGTARLGPAVVAMHVWDFIGRGAVVSRRGGERLAAAVAARSAGLDVNTDKRVCSCDGTTIWEADPLKLPGSAPGAG